MSWREFLIAYSIGGVLCLAAIKIRYSISFLRLLRVIGATAALSFFVDYPAESRGIWRFRAPLARLLEVPIENLIFMAASPSYIILIYLWLQERLRLHDEQSRNRET
jgi:hypothetical protein